MNIHSLVLVQEPAELAGQVVEIIDISGSQVVVQLEDGSVRSLNHYFQGIDHGPWSVPVGPLARIQPNLYGPGIAFVVPGNDEYHPIINVQPVDGPPVTYYDVLNLSTYRYEAAIIAYQHLSDILGEDGNIDADFRCRLAAEIASDIEDARLDRSAAA